MSNAVGEWLKALNFKNYAFYYVQPPDYPDISGYNNFKEKLEQTYYEVYNSNSAISGKNKSVLDKLSSYEKEAEEQELKLFNSINKNKDQTEKLQKRYQDMTSKEKIQYWTNYLYYRGKDVLKIKKNKKGKEYFEIDKKEVGKFSMTTWMKIIFSSQEFNDLMITKGISIFNSTLLLGQSVGRNGIVDLSDLDLNDKIEIKVENIQDGIVEKEWNFLEDEVLEAIINIPKGRKSEVKNNMINIVFASKGTYPIKLKKSSQNKPFLVITKGGEGFFEKAYSEKKQSENKFKLEEMMRQSLKEASIAAIKQMISSTKDVEDKKKYRLKLMGQGTLAVDKEVFQKNAQKVIDNIEKGGKNTYFNKAIDKLSNRAVSMDKGVTGLIGEFLGLLNFQNIMKDLEHTGYINDIDSQNNNFGESFQDLSSEAFGGINIKHYTRVGNQLTLYKSGKNEGVGILDYRINKYFEKDVVEILKFLETNYYVLSGINSLPSGLNQNEIIKKYEQISMLSISNFIRATEAERKERNNFYQLSNLIYPTSVIYKILIKQIKDDKINFFNIIGNFYHEDPITQSYYRAKVIKNDNTKARFTSNRNLVKFNKNNSHKISFQGLKVPLKTLQNLP